MLENGETVKSFSQPIGPATNNIAEYKAVIAALEEAKRMDAERVRLRVDSALVFNQVRGIYKVKHEHIKPLHAQTLKLLKEFKGVEFQLVPREKNKEADLLATSAIKNEPGNTKVNPGDRPDVFHIGEESPSSEG
jgi:ribonuclease HI